MENFNVGQEITLYSRTFKITVSMRLSEKESYVQFYERSLHTGDTLMLMICFRFFYFQGCDDFTHNFLRKLGVRIHDPNNMPSDPYTEHRKKVCSLGE